MSDTPLLGAFGSGAGRYDRLRPAPPAEAVDFGVPMAAADVADIGAGTGKLTVLLVERGHRVVAVEPSVAMRTRLTTRLPGVSVRDARAEATGLPEAGFDVVTFAQSWHWVDPAAASRELSRILRPGGYVSMLWTMPDTGVAWVAPIQAAMHSIPLAQQVATGPDRRRDPWQSPPSGPFSTGERLTTHWSQPMLRGDLRELVTTRSYYLEATSAEQNALREATARAVAAEWPDLPEESSVDLPYVTTVLRYRLSPEE
ncbi:MAG TPA: class I SAM-dependent methyltransferase [Ornithinimicrobium sp.]|uniref:class I SAM-dependent methyltransferase n=1 Tax=Ornithinimicrobium sp. TaxID=1977084 RepID=UPI002B4A5757|nr:class I SAM-dependent methyltransferase [Ornithinimicrobium sp.]HKJ11374.1 class I SAM-dependent methyltransferase [Ornithinimicrobium sp.]